MINCVNREIPEYIDGYGHVRPYRGAFANLGGRIKTGAKIKSYVPGSKKLLSSIEEAIEKTGLRDGMTVSFHHHMRNGDKVVNLVMNAVAAKGIKDIHIAGSGIFQVHEPLVKLIEDGVVTKITTSTFNPGPVAKAITAGKLRKPAVLMSHGGRPRAIESGDLHIDVAFIAAPSCDEYGNLNGTQGKSACGFLSYSYADAMYADCVVAVTDSLVPYPCRPIEISQENVDFVVGVESVGDPGGIVSGTLTVTDDPIRLKIADDTARLADLAGYIKEGMSFQTGAGGTTLAVASRVRDIMKDRGITGSFGLGGIHSYFVKMLEEGLFRALLDTQCFDLEAIGSAARNENHVGIGASMYANPHNRGSVVNNLDLVVLGATEIDTDFNVNVITGSNGVIMGASGGHSDCAAGSKLAIIVANLTRKNFCIVRDKVTTVTTPGETVDVLVTECGIAVNPRRTDILETVKDSDIPLVDINELREVGESLVGEQTCVKVTDRIVSVVEYRDGTVIDTVKMPE
ncbi:MAG: citrate lyase subunit alpha [Clostridiales Family XIII bacterium]|jgi:citrate lyase subunit alpha/citrate CoA-transferase|nr:citrate lyase subunit alpha [Clostridiales Family XIII bacterium]